MATTEKWNITKPVRGSLYWDLPLNTNFDLIDSILYNIRCSFASDTAPTQNAVTGSTWFDTISTCLKVKYTSGYEELLTKTKADNTYLKKTDALSINQLYWYDSATKNMAKIFFNTSKMLEIQFGDSPATDKFVIRWVGTDGTYELVNIFSNKIVLTKNLEIPNGTAINHAINKGQADTTYLSKTSYTAADILAKLKTVDGGNSLLDADLLDGVHADVFARKTDVNSSIATINAILTTGTVNNADKLDGLHASSFLLIANLLSTLKGLDGAGSGLDADTLDGLHASSFAEQPGVIKIWPLSTAPNGYLSCEGQAVSRATYSALFAIIGTTYGAGDGSTTFNLPDLRGVFVRGYDNGREYDTQLNRAFGTVQLDTFASHTHFMFANQVINGGSYPSPTLQVPYREDGSDEKNEYTMRGTNTAATIGLTSSTGNGTETRPKNVNLLYIIKT